MNQTLSKKYGDSKTTHHIWSLEMIPDSKLLGYSRNILAATQIATTVDIILINKPSIEIFKTCLTLIIYSQYRSLLTNLKKSKK
jgi:hypothetical protein